MNKYFFFLIMLVLGCGPAADEMPPETTTVKIAVEDIAIEEGDEDSFVFVRLFLDGPSDNIVTASISSFDVNAEAGSDYVGFENVPVVFEPGDLIAEYRMDFKGDEESEFDETLEVRIVNVEGASIADDTGIVTIINDDEAPNEFNIPQTGYSSPESYPGMTLVWQDEFSGTAIDESIWTFEIGNGSSGWGNNELEYYRKENASIYEDYLVIEAKEENFNGFQYTSTRMITRNKFDFKYGRVDIRAALPTGQGIWPALWMLGSNFQTVGWPACGEIDIMELVGNAPNTVHGTAHWRDSNSQHALYGGDISLSSGIFKDEFHVFSVIWDESAIRWFMDDVQYHVMDTTPASLSEFHEKFFFIFNVAVGGNWPGSPNSSTSFPQHMIVDYIRVFQ